MSAVTPAPDDGSYPAILRTIGRAPMPRLYRKSSAGTSASRIGIPKPWAGNRISFACRASKQTKVFYLLILTMAFTDLSDASIAAVAVQLPTQLLDRLDSRARSDGKRLHHGDIGLLRRKFLR